MRAAAELGRYLIWQLPGWLVMALALGLVVRALELPGWVVAAGTAVLIARDLLLFPAMRVVFRPARPTQPLGARAQVVQPLAPAGYVRIGGELWQATTRHGRRVEAGHAVLVREARGLTLIVEEAGDEG